MALAAVTLALACAGCSDEAPGDPGTRPPAATLQPGQLQPINSPGLDLAEYRNRVCDLLTLEQLAPLAIKSPGARADGEAGPACTWDPPNPFSGAAVRVLIMSKLDNGWESVYQGKDRWAKFENAGEIKGYPAVHIQASKTDAEKGICSTDTGVRRDLVFEVNANVYEKGSADYKNPCSVSDRVAGLVIDTLKRGR